MIRVDELARRIGAELIGPTSSGQLEVSGLAPFEMATPDDVSFLPDPKRSRGLANCEASAVIVDSESLSLCPTQALVSSNCLLACARAAHWLTPVSREQRASSRSQQRHERIDENADIARTATIGRCTSIGTHTRIGPGCNIGDGVRIGAYCEIGANVTMTAAASLGNRVSVEHGSVIGGGPFSYIRDGTRWLKLPGFGGVDIGDDVALGCGVTIDRGALGQTSLGRGTKIDAQVHIGHGCEIGEDCAIAARTAIAGEVTIGDRCVIGGAVGIAEGLVVASEVRITGMSMVSKSLLVAGASYSSGWPAKLSRAWWRQVALSSR